MSSQRRDTTEEMVATPSLFRSEWAVSRGWQQLELVHTPFRATEAREYRDLIARLSNLERIFLDRPALRWYHAESHLGETGREHESGQDRERDPGAVRHVIAMQAQLMEDVFFVLQLDRFANAPDNRGWMNLFRRWGRSETFTREFAAIRDALTVDFLSFYDMYVADWDESIDARPVPHSWDPPHLRTRGGKARVDARGISPSAPPRSEELLPGVYLDGGRSATAPATRGQTPESNTATGESSTGKDSGSPNE